MMILLRPPPLQVLLSSTEGRALDPRPLALAVGYLEPEPQEKVKPPRKQAR